MAVAAESKATQMTRVVLDDIPLHIEMDRLLTTLSIKTNSIFAQEVAELVEIATAIGKPKVLYKQSHIDCRGEGFVVVDGVTLKSTIVQINTQETDTVFPFVATCGKELEEWSNSVDSASRFYVEAIKQLALDAAEVAFGKHIEKHCSYEICQLSALSGGELFFTRSPL